MPYPNEHAARLRSPQDFDAGSFRRTEGGTIYGKIKVPATIGIIWGKLKGKAKPADPVMPQALRFPTKNWTAAAARAWLKRNKVRYVSFEPASGKKATAVDYSRVPALAGWIDCAFEAGGMIAVADEGDGPVVPFEMTVYTGKPMEHWFYGKVVIDLATLQLHKATVPALRDHATGRIVGVANRMEIAAVCKVWGDVYADQDEGRDVIGLLRHKFPMEASGYFKPGRITEIAEGASHKVNGVTVDGPARVFYDTRIREVSFTTFGLDDDTEARLAAAGEGTTMDLSGIVEIKNLGGEDMPRKKTDEGAERVTIDALTAGEITAEDVESIQAEHAAAIEAVTKEVEDKVKAATGAGRTAGRTEAVEAIKAMAAHDDLKDRPGFVLAELIKGSTIDEARANLIPILKQEAADAKAGRMDGHRGTPGFSASDAAEGENGTPPAAPAGTAPATGDAALKAFEDEFNASPELQAEFTSARAYALFKAAEAEGRVHELDTEAEHGK